MKKLLFAITLLILSGCDQQSSFEPILPPSDPLPDFTSYTDVKEKKQAFFDYLLPLIHTSNQNISEERQLLKKWIDHPEQLSKNEQQAIEEIQIKYRVVEDDADSQQEKLLRRVRALPPSLVLAQAANESAWGSSRFALEGNNLFGQWCYELGCGLIPGERNHRAKHEVRVFESPYESVSSYMRNLNSHPQYKDLRMIRADLLQQHETVTGTALAEGLVGYSERREEYVAEIQAMIRHNDLESYDNDPFGMEPSEN